MVIKVVRRGLKPFFSSNHFDKRHKKCVHSQKWLVKQLGPSFSHSPVTSLIKHEDCKHLDHTSQQPTYSATKANYSEERSTPHSTYYVIVIVTNHSGHLTTCWSLLLCTHHQRALITSFYWKQWNALLMMRVEHSWVKSRLADFFVVVPPSILCFVTLCVKATVFFFLRFFRRLLVSNALQF